MAGDFKIHLRSYGDDGVIEAVCRIRSWYARTTTVSGEVNCKRCRRIIDPRPNPNPNPKARPAESGEEG